VVRRAERHDGEVAAVEGEGARAVGVIEAADAVEVVLLDRVAAGAGQDTGAGEIDGARGEVDHPKPT